MDLDGDGVRDVLSGSYPGEIYLFRGQADGTFAPAERLKDTQGDDLNLGKAAAVFAADWDRTGDLDLVVGDIQGRVWWVPNRSGGKELQFEDGMALTADGTDIRVAGGDAGPTIADWDGDGTLDLVLGAGDGSVWFYPNRNPEGSPDLGAPQLLVAATPGGMSRTAGEEPRPGTRAKPWVADFDGDGKTDLLVGDVMIVKPEPRVLSDEEKAAIERLKAERAWVLERYGPRMQEMNRQVRARLAEEVGDPALAGTTGPIPKELGERHARIWQEQQKQDVTLRALMQMLQAKQQAISEYEPRGDLHGHVWVFARR